MAKTIRQPVTGGIARTPMVMQLEALECGAACLTMILAYYEKWIPLEQVRKDCGVSRDGSNARQILNAARHYGMSANGFRMEPEQLRERGMFPCIVHWNFNHFVVLNGFRGRKASVNDPARGTITMSMEDFDRGFTGVCIMMEPGETFVPSGHKKSMLAFAAKRLQGTGAAVAFSVLTAVISALMGLLQPGFSRVFLDRLLTGENPDWFVPFMVLLGGFSFFQILMTAIRSVYDLRLSGKMNAVGSTSYMWKVLRLPMNFFSQRMAGDIQGRMADNAGIAGTLIDTFAPLALNLFMMVFYLVAMVRYSWKLTLVGLCATALSTAVSNFISRKRVNITRVYMRDSARLNAVTVAGIEMIETIKSSGAENGFFSRWSGYQAGANAKRMEFTRLNQYLGMVPKLLFTLAGNVILIMGVWLTMQGQFTAGMVMAFQGFLNAFTAPVQTLVSAGQTLQEMRTQMERVEDVMEYPEDDAFCDEPGQDAEYRKLSGLVEVQNITFGYAPLAQPLIRDFSLRVEPGRSVALVGASGCGKSTISKLISGLYQPWSGQILFDGKPMCQIDRGVFHGSLAVVDQDSVLFEDTIANNIKMWDDSIEDFEMILAARDAQIHDDIMLRAGGYQHRIREGGRDFSGGQRQRMEIARVLAQDPTIIILDEATSALDARTEYDVVKAIRDRGITCIVIAHRLSTIRSCDEILVLEQGSVVGRGRHAELMESCSLYRELVSSE